MKKKVIYSSLLILAIIFVSTAYYSYAFFTHKLEEHGKLNIVVGTLNYQIESKDLNNNQITIPANTTKEIVIIVTSLNTIASKYELFYEVENKSTQLDIGYTSNTTDLPTGEIETKGKKKITIFIRNYSNQEQTITFGVEGGLKNNNLALKKGYHISEISYYAENILNGANPELTDNIVPVTIEDDGTVKKANIYEPWYSYESQEWANSIVVRNSYDTLNSYGKVNGAKKENGSVSFDGIDDYIDLGLENYDFQNTITLAIRVKISEIPTKVGDFFGNWDGAGGGISYTENRIYSQFYINNSSSGYKQVSYFITNWEEFMKDYHTLVTTYDGNTIKLYIDGKVVVQNEAPGTIKTSPVAFALGADFDKSGSIINYSNVNIESAAIYDRALDQDEITKSFTDEIQIYNSEKLLIYEDFREKEYENNEVIPEDSIESYFVWIPKYKYKLFNMEEYNSLTSFKTEKPPTIEVQFGLTNTSNSNNGECTTPGVAGVTGSCKLNDYMTHPAFLAFGGKGFWVGKFETGYEGATKTSEAQINSSEQDKIIIKPNVYSWRSISIGNAFQASYEYQKDLESHMMKNTEWGAVAYLQHSKYGSQESVRVNNNSSYITGYAATKEPTLGYNKGQDIEGNHIEGTELHENGTYTKMYNTIEGYHASTTGNITGVYDMSGGAWEYVMGYTTAGTNEQSGITKIYPEFFTDDQWKKYYDSYETTINTQYNNRILGDATGEMGPFGREQDPDDQYRPKSSWYEDCSAFVDLNNPWYTRSGDWYYGSVSGLFTFSGYTGIADFRNSFRIVLTP